MLIALIGISVIYGQIAFDVRQSVCEIQDCTLQCAFAPKGWLIEMSEENFDIFDEEELNNLVYLCDDEGNEMAFEYLDCVEYHGEEYVLLISTDEDDDEVVILKLDKTSDDDGEGDSFVSVDDENIAAAVFEIFKENNKDFYDFAD